MARVTDERLREAGTVIRAGSVRPAMVDDASLEMNVLSFREKSFSFDRTLTLGPTEYVVFHRTEVESESRFRPKLLRLTLAIPRGVILGDLASEMLVLAADGKTPGPRRTASAQEVDAEEAEFREQGIDFVRHRRADDRVIYVPKDAPPELSEQL